MARRTTRGRGSELAAAICRWCGSIRKIRTIVYSASVVCWKSTDGGKTWDGWRGAPGGDDYQNVWINPNNPDIILLGCDQGAIITVNGGKTWSSWYNQSTAQLYHVSADNTFPYRLYSGQQESGSVGITSRGERRRDYISRLATGCGGGIRLRRRRSARSRHHLRREADAIRSSHRSGAKHTAGAVANGRLSDVADRASRLFTARSAFALLRREHAVANTRPWRNWQKISPDLSRKNYEVPATVGKYKEDATKQAHGAA